MKLHDINEVTFPPRLQNTHNSFGSVLGIYQEKFSCNVFFTKYWKLCKMDG